MSKTHPRTPPSEAETAAMSPVELAGLVRSQAATIEALQHRVAWFERQVFGSKSERLSVLENSQ